MSSVAVTSSWLGKGSGIFLKCGGELDDLYIVEVEVGDGGPVHHVLVLVGRGGVRGVHVLGGRECVRGDLGLVDQMPYMAYTLLTLE